MEPDHLLVLFNQVNSHPPVCLLTVVWCLENFHRKKSRRTPKSLHLNYINLLLSVRKCNVFTPIPIFKADLREPTTMIGALSNAYLATYTLACKEVFKKTAAKLDVLQELLFCCSLLINRGDSDMKCF